MLCQSRLVFVIEPVRNAYGAPFQDQVHQSPFEDGVDSPPIFITDAELSRRWHCSVMKIWRMRQDGRLNPGIKPGGGGPNLNYLSHILEVEAKAAAEAAARETEAA
jgi:hypothetical protein